MQAYALIGQEQRTHLYMIKVLQYALQGINEPQQNVKPEDLTAAVEVVSLLARRCQSAASSIKHIKYLLLVDMSFWRLCVQQH